MWGPILAGVIALALFVVHSLHTDNPIIDLRLFGHDQFAAASATVLFVGAALFGALFVLPLYFQIARGESAFDAGLLLAPQGLGAAAAMPLAGTITDRIGGGRVAVVGLLLIAAGTVPFALMAPGTSLWWLEGALVVRGIGLGCTMMPSMAAAYAPLDSDAVPRATSAINVLQRVGGSIGTAVLAVVLYGQLSDLPGAGGNGQSAVRQLPDRARERLAEPLTSAFGTTFWWAVGLAVVALVPALVLAWRGGPPDDGDDDAAAADRDDRFDRASHDDRSVQGARSGQA